jgi:hypothetical protein
MERFEPLLDMPAGVSLCWNLGGRVALHVWWGVEQEMALTTLGKVAGCLVVCVLGNLRAAGRYHWV